MRSLLLVVAGLFSVAAWAQDDDLGSAFEPPPPPKQYQPEHNVPAPPVPEDPNAELRATFQKDFGAAQKALDKGDAAGAREQLVPLEVAAVMLGPAERLKVHKLQHAAAGKAGDKAGVKEAAEKWLTACGPNDVAACRKPALEALAALDKDRAEKLRAADACLDGAEPKAGRALPPCLDAAAALYQKADDALMVARIELLRALGQVNAGKAKPAKDALAKLGGIADDRLAHVRKAALEALSRLELAAGNAEAAAKAAIQAAGAYAAALPPDGRVWARTAATEAACAAYEKTKGADACHALEKTLLGDYVFRDFSTEHVGDRLPHENMAAVNAHYNVLVQACLNAEIRRLKGNTALIYRVKWLVLNNGRVDAVHAESAQFEGSLFVKCLRNQFGYWRYPRHDGDPQRIEQGFSVKSSMRSEGDVD